MTAAPDVVVIGAGLVGTMTFLGLAEAGVRTTLIDADFPGGGSTGAAMGHIVAMDDSPAQLALCGHSRERWNVLVAGLPKRGEYERCGTIWVAADDGELESARHRQAAYAATGIAAHLLDAAELYRAEPFLRPGLAGGLFVPDDAVCYPPAVAHALTERAVALGGTHRPRTAVTAVGSHVVHLADGSSIPTGSIVIAAGCASPQLIDGLPIVPRKGHLVITDRRPGMIRHQLIELGYLKSAHSFDAASVAFNVQPRRTGQVLIGSSRELVGFDSSINRHLLAEMLARASTFIPELAGARALRTWTGFRPTTPDKLPLIGRWPALADVWIAAGHEGLGITMATGTADMIVTGILGTESPVDPAPFRPDRPMLQFAPAA